MPLEYKRRASSFRVLLSVSLLICLLTALVYIVYLRELGTTYKQQQQDSNKYQLDIISQEKANIQVNEPVGRFGMNEFEDIDRLLEQTNSLSAEMIEKFDKDIVGFNIKPVQGKQIHQDYIYHNKNKKTEQRVCTKPYEVVLICLDDTDLKTRDLYRKTWATEHKTILTSDGVRPLSWKILFVIDVPRHVARHLEFENEQDQHRDVIAFWSHKPRKTTLKLMSAMEWVDEHCDYTFLVKMESGMFLNTPKLFSFLNDPRIPTTEFYGGRVTYETNKTTTFHSREKSLKKGYPRYINQTFVLSFDVVDKVIKKFHWSRPHPKADVYIGELVLQSGVDVWPIISFLSSSIDGKCELRLIQESALIEVPNNCFKNFAEHSNKLIPEI